MKPPSILVVDDDPRMLAAVERILRRSRYQVVTATSGRIGLRLAVHSPPDLILLDVSMPKMSGHEFLRRLRRLEACGRIALGSAVGDRARSEIPVLFVTALGAPHQRVSGLDAGAVDYITKPFDPDELRARVRRHLRQASRQRQALSALRLELMRLESVLLRLQEAALACRQPLADLDAYIALAEAVRRPELRDDMLRRAHRDVRRLTHSLSQIAAQAVGGEVRT